jgi:hypothetical protein
MNSTRTFIIFALVLGAFVAVAQILVVVFAPKRSVETITAASISLLPESLNIDQLKSFTDRAEKYLVLTPRQFEDGVDPNDALNATPTVTP